MLCATRGEAGESRIVTDDLAALREAELKTRQPILGVGTVRLLDHGDSGHERRARRRARWRRRPVAVGGEVRAVIDELPTRRRRHARRQRRPPRPRRRSATPTLAAVDAMATTTRRRPTCGASHGRRWRNGPSTSRHGGDEGYLAVGELGTPDDEITTVLDVAAHLADVLGGDPRPRQSGESLRRSPGRTPVRPSSASRRTCTRQIPEGPLTSGEGFEPSEACTSTVFKTVPFGRSGTPPPVRLERARQSPVVS